MPALPSFCWHFQLVLLRGEGSAGAPASSSSSTSPSASGPTFSRAAPWYQPLIDNPDASITDFSLGKAGIDLGRERIILNEAGRGARTWHFSGQESTITAGSNARVMIFCNDSENGYAFHINTPDDEGKDFWGEACGAIFASTPPPVGQDVSEWSVDLVASDDFAYRVVITLPVETGEES